MLHTATPSHSATSCLLTHSPCPIRKNRKGETKLDPIGTLALDLCWLALLESSLRGLRRTFRDHSKLDSIETLALHLCWVPSFQRSLYTASRTSRRGSRTVKVLVWIPCV